MFGNPEEHLSDYDYIPETTDEESEIQQIDLLIPVRRRWATGGA